MVSERVCWAVLSATRPPRPRALAQTLLSRAHLGRPRPGRMDVPGLRLVQDIHVLINAVNKTVGPAKCLCCLRSLFQKDLRVWICLGSRGPGLSTERAGIPALTLCGSLYKADKQGFGPFLSLGTPGCFGL